MKRRIAIRHLLAALALLGLVLAPLTPPASAMAVSMDMAAAGDESKSNMPEGMPCCPDQPAKPDCAKDCPFIAVCAGTMVPVMSGGAGLSVPLGLLTVVVPGNDAKLNGLAQGPPAKPPKA